MNKIDNFKWWLPQDNGIMRAGAGGIYWARLVREGLRGMTFEPRPEWWEPALRRIRITRRNNMCKGPETEMSLVRLRSRQKGPCGWTLEGRERLPWGPQRAFDLGQKVEFDPKWICLSCVFLRFICSICSLGFLGRAVGGRRWPLCVPNSPVCITLLSPLG